MRLDDLLSVPSLALRLMHGDDEALNRPVRWVCTTDLLDPTQYLTGGELVLTGLVWHRSAADSERFVSAVSAANAAALGAGEAVFGQVPSDLVAACRRHDLPLLAVPTQVSFGQITEHVVGAVSAERGTRLAATLASQRELLSWLAQGRSLDELTAKVCDDTGLACHVLTATGRPVGIGRHTLRDTEIDRLTRAFLGAERLPVITPEPGPPHSLFAVGPGLGHRAMSWFVAAEGIWTNWDAETADAVSALAALAALDRVRRDEGVRVSRQVTLNALARVKGAAADRPQAAAWTPPTGASPQPPVLTVVACFPGRDDLLETARAILDDVAAGLGSASAATIDEGVAVALLPGGGGALDDLRRRLARLAPGTTGTRLAVGVGGPASAPALGGTLDGTLDGTLGGALDAARHALRIAQLRDDSVSVVASDEVTSSVLLLATVPDEVRRAFSARVLGPVLEYDAAHETDLLGTARAFLDCSGSWSRAADLLHLHVNTVRYRVARIEELTGRNLADLEDRVDVFLALRSL